MVSNNCEQRILYLFYVIFIFYTFQLIRQVGSLGTILVHCDQASEDRLSECVSMLITCAPGHI